MPRQVALLRGINLGSVRRVPMPALRDLLGGLGYGQVRTLVQSGNVVLESDLSPDRLAKDLGKVIAAEFGVDTPVVVRTRDELADVIERDPFGELATTPKWYQVTFLSAEPDAEAVSQVEAADLAPERVVFSGREVYAWHPAGMQRSRLAGLLTDKRLGVTATARNWNTVTKLLELADS